MLVVKEHGGLSHRAHCFLNMVAFYSFGVVIAPIIIRVAECVV